MEAPHRGMLTEKTPQRIKCKAGWWELCTLSAVSTHETRAARAHTIPDWSRFELHKSRTGKSKTCVWRAGICQTGSANHSVPSSLAFSLISSTCLPRKAATSVAGLPRRSASSKKNRSCLLHFAHPAPTVRVCAACLKAGGSRSSASFQSRRAKSPAGSSRASAAA